MVSNADGKVESSDDEEDGSGSGDGEEDKAEGGSEGFIIKHKIAPAKRAKKSKRQQSVKRHEARAKTTRRSDKKKYLKRDTIIKVFIHFAFSLFPTNAN